MQEAQGKAAVRYHDLDALRAVAMILGIALHGALSFVPFPWSVQDSEQHELFGTFFTVIHGFRMPVFFVMSGFFTAMLWRRRGLASILKQRFLRVFLPCMVGIFTICPLQDWVGGFVYTQTPPEWPFEVEEETLDPAALVERAESLPIAAKLGQGAVVEELLARGDDVNTRDDWGATALHWAAVTSEEGIVRTLIEEGADVNAKTGDGSRPLHWAAFLGEPVIVELLLEAGADPSVRNQKRETPLDTVRAPWSEEMAGIVKWVAGFMKIEVDVDRIKEDRPAIVALFEATGLRLDLPSAAKRGDLDAVRALLEEGADTEERMGDKSSALHWAAVHSHYEIVEALFEAGADRNVRHEDGGTPLHWVAFLGESEMVELLLKEGADPNIANYSGLTPLDTISPSWDELEGVTMFFAGIMELEVDLDELKEDRPAIIEALKAAGAEGGGGDSGFEALIGGLMFKNVFHHLWFLWFLCLLVVVFAIYAAMAQVVGLRHLPRALIVSPLRYLWLLPVTLLPQLMMHGGSASGFGPDTATGWIPFPHLFFYYAIFFFFGAFYSDCEDEEQSLGSRWWITLPLALLVVFPLGLEFSVDGSWSLESFSAETRHLIGASLQVLFCWLMIFGLIGAFRRFFSAESPKMRYISDSSYWLYLLHLPLIVLGQWFVRDWPISPFIKFTLMCGVVTGLLLLSYQLFVRYTPLGTFLNGRRTRPKLG